MHPQATCVMVTVDSAALTWPRGELTVLVQARELIMRLIVRFCASLYGVLLS